MMFYEKFEHRILAWHVLRQDVETHVDPINKVLQFWNQAPISTRSCDPFEKNTWLNAWQLIEENKYCEFSKILAIYYTLSLTDRFQHCHFEISICIDKKKEKLYYLLFVDSDVIGYYYDQIIDKKDISSDLFPQASYVLTAD